MLLLFVALPARASTYESFDAEIAVARDASFVVTETITGTFSIPRHGIYRNIPVRYQTDAGTNQSIVLDVLSVTRDGAAEPFEETYADGYAKIRIGDADVTFEGPFTYQIAYRVERAILYHDDADELYWNVTGNDWDEPLGAVGATIGVDGDVGPEGAGPLSATCYTGAYGSGAQDCVAAVRGATVTVDAHDFLTVSVLVPKGILAEPSVLARFGWFLRDNLGLLAAALLPFVTLIGLFLHWHRHGRDTKPGVVVAEYGPPDDLRPAEIGLLVNAMEHQRMFVATIVDFAVRGYLRIREEETKRLLGTSRTYALERMRPADGAMGQHERALLDGLFQSGESVALPRQDTFLLKARQAFEGSLNASLAERGYFVTNPRSARSKFHVTGGVLVALAFFLPLSGWFTASVGVTGGLFFLFGALMPKRSALGDAAYAKALGFKLYLETAEKYRVEWQEKEGIFERFLPYAIVFGVADKWAKALADVAREQPDWYAGHFAAWNASAFSDRLGSFGTTLAAAAAPRSSGGRSGGFSGGGFGGGGGGSW